MDEFGVAGAVGALLAAFGLSGAAGLNAWLPLLGLGLAARSDVVELGPAYDWLSSTGGLIAIGTLLVLDLIGDKIPALDSLLHTVGLALAPASGAVLFAAQTELTSGLPPVVAVILGGLTAETVHAGRTVLRPWITASTGGLGNPGVSAAEDGVSLGMTLLAFAVPLLAFLLVVAVLVLLVVLLLKARRWLLARRVRRDDRR